MYGFKLKLVHLHAQRIEHPAEFFAGLHDTGWRIIHLRRRNVLRAIISSDVATRRGAFHHRVSDGPLGPVRRRVDPHQILQRVARREASLAAEERALADLPRLTLWYEDDLLRADRHQRTGDAVFAYLGLVPVPVRTQHVRLTPDHLSEVVENYDESVQVVGATQYAGLLAEA